MEAKAIQKRFKNSSGDILVRPSLEHGPGIVEMMHLWNRNESGCTIGYWEERMCDHKLVAEFRSCGPRFVEADVDEVEILFKALRYGQKLADILVETKGE